MASDDRRFPTTIWDDIRSACGGNARGLDQLLGRYRPPVVGFLRWKGVPEDEAEDLAQEVLIRLAKPAFLEKVDSDKGRFRSLVLAVTRHVLSEARRHAGAARRGGDVRLLKEGDFAEGSPGLAAVPSEDSVFDRLWIAELVARAVASLDDESALRGSPVASVFRLKYLEGLSQEEIAERLTCSLSNVKNHIHSGRLKFQAFLLASVKDYCATPEDFAAEAGRLAPYWKGDGA
jgi:RNA polymerase sigma factor (sigma-70 family)